jgi:hypothetical protein
MHKRHGPLPARRKHVTGLFTGHGIGEGGGPARFRAMRDQALIES